MKNDSYYTEKLLGDMRYIEKHMDGISESAFSGNELLQDAMMFRLIQISENARKLSDAYRSMHNQLPWGDMFGLRNRIVHDYGAVDLHIVYSTLTVDIPDLIAQLGAL